MVGRMTVVGKLPLPAAAERRRSAAAIAMALPGLIVAAACGLSVILAMLGVDTLWPRTELNLAEAAAMRDAAEVTRLIERGDSLTASWPVRAGLVSESATSLTPLEAAVASRDRHMIDLLYAAGTRLDATQWLLVRCAADIEEVMDALDAHRPADVLLDCPQSTAR